MTREEIVEAVNAAFEEMEIPREELTPEKEFFKDLGLDSLDMVDLMVGLQRKFKISLRQSEEMKKIVTLQDLYDFIAEKEAEIRAEGVNTQEIVDNIVNSSNKE